MNRNVDAGMTPERATAWDRRVWRVLLPYLGEHTGLSRERLAQRHVNSHLEPSLSECELWRVSFAAGDIRPDVRRRHPRTHLRIVHRRRWARTHFETVHTERRSEHRRRRRFCAARGRWKSIAHVRGGRRFIAKLC